MCDTAVGYGSRYRGDGLGVPGDNRGRRRGRASAADTAGRGAGRGGGAPATDHARSEDIPALVGGILHEVGAESDFLLLDTPVELDAAQLAGATFRLAYISVGQGMIRTIEHVLGRPLIGLPIPYEQVRVLTDVLRTRQPVFLDPPEEAVRQVVPWLPAPAAHQLMRLVHAATMVIAPLLSRSRVLGVMTVWANDLRREDTTILGAFARQAGIALDTARLSAQTERQARRLAALGEIGRDVAGTLELEEVLVRVVQRAADAMGVAHSGLWLLDYTASGEPRLRLAASQQLSPAHQDLLTTLFRDNNFYDTPTYRAIVARAPRQCDDLRTTAPEDVSPSLRDFLLAERYASFISVPVLTQTNEAIGALVTYAGQPDFFLPDAAAYLEAIGRHAAIAISHARLYLDAREAGHATERAAAEASTILEAMPDGVFVVDARGAVVRVNANGAAMLGLSVDAAKRTAKGYSEMLKIRYLDGTLVPAAAYPRAFALGGVTHPPQRFLFTRHDTGEEAEMRTNAAPIRDALGAITGAVVVASDITELARLERQKDEFLGIASHELKTPLTSMKVLAQLTRRKLEGAGVPEAEQLARMERAIGRMELLVNDLLDVSRIQSGKLALRLETCDLVAVCRTAMQEQLAIAGRDVRLDTPDIPDTPILVEADADRIGQVLTNLLTNAIKYSPAGAPVTLGVSRTDGAARVEVRDAGPGISPEAQTHLFERFYRVPGVEVQRGSGIGLGLGLYISRTIVERHGGRIGVESTPGEGATFWFTLPVAADAS